MLQPEQIQQNWELFMNNISTFISGDRQKRLLHFYNHFQDRFILMPASYKPQYHNCFPGGYVDHVNRVLKIALETKKIWTDNSDEIVTDEEIAFVAINHDLGKFGTIEEPSYIPNTSEWHIKNRGELYAFNSKLEYMAVPDRSIYLLNQLKVPMSQKEYLGIKLHDGLYDEANKSYFINYAPETKLRTSIPFIIHHADLTASRIEFMKVNKF